MRGLLFKAFVPLAAALLLMAYVVWDGQQDSLNLQAIHYEQIDDMEDLAQNLALEHLWLEEYQSTGDMVNRQRFLMQRQKAEGLLSDLLRHSRNARDRGIKAHTRLDAVLVSLQQKFGSWQKLAYARLSGIGGHQAGIIPGVADENFDLQFSRLIKVCEQAELLVREQLDDHMQHMRRQNMLMFLLTVLLVISAITYMFLSFRRRVKGMQRENALLGRLRESEDSFRGLFESSPISLWLEDFSGLRAYLESIRASGVADFRTYFTQHPEAVRECVSLVRVLDMNQAALHLHGATEKGQLLAGIGNTFTEESFETFGEEVLAFSEGKTEIGCQARVRRLDGTPVDVMLSVKVMPGHEASLDRVLVAMTDISKRVRAEAGLRESERRLQQAQVVARMGNWELDIPSGELQWSDEVFRMFEIEPAGSGASCGAFLARVHPDDRAGVEQAFKRHLEEDVPYDIEHRMLFDDGRIKYMRELCATERDAHGKPLRSLGSVQDVTERVLVEHAKVEQAEKMEHVQRLESLGVLAGGIAHDFNNILTAIMGHASLARNEASPAGDTRRHLQAIEDASRKASELCRQMLAYAGKGRFVVRPVNLSELVGEMMRLLQVSISKGALLRDELASSLPAIEADVAQMQQVVMNLVINANEAIGERSGMIMITTGVMDADADYLHNTYVQEVALEPGRYVYLEVNDTGCGMSPETRKRLFEPFYTTKFAGRGLGMSAILGIVRGHHGAIKVYTEEGKGTTFKVLFPAVRTDAVSLEGGEDTGEQTGSGTVLVVDDEESIRTVAAMMLDGAGYQTIQAKDGVEAVERLREHGDGIDCVLLDMTMPRMGGEEAFMEMRRIRPDIRVVLSSGYNQQSAMQRFAGKGLAGFVQKPYTPDALLRALAEVLQKG